MQCLKSAALCPQFYMVTVFSATILWRSPVQNHQKLLSVARSWKMVSWAELYWEGDKKPATAVFQLGSNTVRLVYQTEKRSNWKVVFLKTELLFIVKSLFGGLEKANPCKLLWIKSREYSNINTSTIIISPIRCKFPCSRAVGLARASLHPILQSKGCLVPFCKVKV